MDTATKTEVDAAKTASRKVIRKTTKATGDLIGNIIADKIASVDQRKSKEKGDETNKDKKFTYHQENDSKQ